MARRWFVRTADNVITNMTEFDEEPVPTGEVAVLETDILAANPNARIRVGGTYVVATTTYTAPAGLTGAALRDSRRRILAQNIERNWVLAVNGALPDATRKRISRQIEALVRCIVVDGSIDNHYTNLLNESLVNGKHFIRYASSAWDADDTGYYPDSATDTANLFPQGANWRLHTIWENLAGTPTQDGTGGTTHTGIGRNINPMLNWAQELVKFANP